MRKSVSSLTSRNILLARGSHMAESRGQGYQGDHRALRQRKRVQCEGTNWGHFWNLTHNRCLSRRDLICVSEMHKL